MKMAKNIISKKKSDVKEHAKNKLSDIDPQETDRLAPETSNNEEHICEPPEKKSAAKKIADFRSNITVEPMMICFITSVMISNMSSQNLYLEKACRVNLNFSKEVCDALERRETENYTDYEKQVQVLTAYIAAWKTVMTTIVPCLLILFVGSYSDKTGRRKLFIIMPLVGETIACLFNFVHVFFFNELGVEYLAFTESFFAALGGGFCVMFLGVFSYISDITHPDTRTFRMGVLNFCMTVGFPLGMSLSGVLLKKFGFYVVYGISVSVNILNILYGIFVLKDPVREKPAIKENAKFFDLKNVKNTLAVVCSGPPARNRRIWLLLVTVCMLFGPLYGEIHVLYLSTRFRFNWDAVSFSMYLTFNFIIHSVGTVFSIVVLSKILKWHDSVLGIISTFSKMAGAAVSAFALTGIQFYFGPVAEIMNGTSLLALRSLLSKLVSSEEQGKINSVTGLAEQMMPLLYAPLYTKVYSATISVFPGFVFLLSGALQILPAITFIYLFVEHRRQRHLPTSTAASA